MTAKRPDRAWRAVVPGSAAAVLILVGGTRLGGKNPFDSSIEGTPDRTFVNSIGGDIEAYDLTIDSPAGTLRIDATSAKDGIRLAVLGLSVDLGE